MSEWLKEHAWKAKWPKITERYRNTLLRNRFNDLPPPDAPRRDSVNVCIRRRFRAHLTQFLHSSRFRLPRPVSLDANFFRLTMAASCERVRECSSHRHGFQPCRTRDRASRRRDAGRWHVRGLHRAHGRSAALRQPTARRAPASHRSPRVREGTRRSIASRGRRVCRRESSDRRRSVLQPSRIHCSSGSCVWSSAPAASASTSTQRALRLSPMEHHSIGDQNGISSSSNARSRSPRRDTPRRVGLGGGGIAGIGEIGAPVSSAFAIARSS